MIVEFSPHRWHQWFGVFIVGISCATFSQQSVADEEAIEQVEPGVSENSATEETRNRIDVGAIFLDGLSADSVNGSISYTRSLTGNSNLSVSASYLDPDTATGHNSGFGDTIFSLSFVPYVKVGANPWVPRTVGSGIAILAPTGNADDGRSLDAWVVAPFLGLVIPLTGQIFFAPQLGYVHSLDRVLGGVDLRLAFTEIGFSYVSDNGFWASYFPQFVFDLERDDWAINHRVAVGKMFSQNVGISVDYVFVERFAFGSDLIVVQGFDEQIELNVHFAY